MSPTTPQCGPHKNRGHESLKYSPAVTPSCREYPRAGRPSWRQKHVTALIEAPKQTPGLLYSGTFCVGNFNNLHRASHGILRAQSSEKWILINMHHLVCNQDIAVHTTWLIVIQQCIEKQDIDAASLHFKSPSDACVKPAFRDILAYLYQFTIRFKSTKPAPATLSLRDTQGP